MNRSTDYASSSLALMSALLLASGDAASLGYVDLGGMDREGVFACGSMSASMTASCVGMPVGGLLDTSKGWTLNIPMPGEADSAAQRIARQQAPSPQPAQNDAGEQTRVIASR